MARSTVAVRFTGDVADLKSKMGQVDGGMSGLGSKFSSVGKVAALGFAAAGAAVVGFAAKSADTFARVGGEVLKLQRYTGATAEEASRLRFAGKQAGLGVDDMTKSLGLLSKGLAGTKFDKFHLDLKNADGSAKPLNESLLKIADRFKTMPAGAEKNALAMTLFGKAGMSMVPFLNRGAAGIAELEKQSDKFGNTLSGKDLDAVKESTKNHRLFSSAMEGLQIQIGRYVLPIVTKFTTFLATNMPGAIATVRSVMETLAPVFETVGNAISTVFGQVSLFVNALRSGFTEDEGTPIEMIALKIRAAFQAVVDWFQQNWPQIKATVEQVMGDITTAIQTGVAIVTAVWNVFGDNIMSAIQRVWPPIKQIIEGVMQEIRGVIQVITSLIHGDWSGVWNGIKLIFSGAWNEMLGIVKLIFEQIRFAISVALDAVGVVFKAGWDALVSFAASLPGRIVGALAALAGMLGNLAHAAGTAYLNALKAEFSAAVTFVTSVPGKVISALGDVSKLLYNAGVEIMKSLLNGVTAGFNAVKHFVGGVAHTIASLKGPLSYDATLLLPHGNAIMQSLMDGLQARYGPLLAMVGKIAGDVSSQMTAGLAGMPGIGGLSDQSSGRLNADIASWLPEKYLPAQGFSSLSDSLPALMRALSAGDLDSRTQGNLTADIAGLLPESLLPAQGITSLGQAIQLLQQAMGSNTQAMNSYVTAPPEVHLHLDLGGAVITQGIEQLVAMLTPALRQELSQILSRNPSLAGFSF